MSSTQINVLESTYISSIETPKSNEWGRTVIDNKIGRNKFIDYGKCELQNRDGIISVLIDHGNYISINAEVDPNVYIPGNNFKYNIFDSYYSTIILKNN